MYKELIIIIDINLGKEIKNLIEEKLEMRQSQRIADDR